MNFMPKYFFLNQNLFVFNLADILALSPVEYLSSKTGLRALALLLPPPLPPIAGLLNNTPDPTDEDIDQQVTNICRCGTYQRIVAAIELAASMEG